MFLNSQSWTWTCSFLDFPNAFENQQFTVWCFFSCFFNMFTSCSFLAFSEQLWTMEIVLAWTTTPWSGDSKLLAEDCFQSCLKIVFFHIKLTIWIHNHRFSRWVTQPTNLSLDWFCWKNLNRKPWAFTIKYGGSCIFSLKPIHWKMVMFRILPSAELVILLLDLTYSWRTLAALASGSWRNLTNGRWADERMNENGLTSGINGEIDVNDIHIIYYSNIRTYIIYIYIYIYILKYVYITSRWKCFFPEDQVSQNSSCWVWCHPLFDPRLDLFFQQITNGSFNHT